MKNRLSEKANSAFGEIFLFEIKYRLKRPDTYLYFITFFLITFLSFSTGNVPAQYNSHVNAPLVITKYFAFFSFFMMVITAAIMGAPLYRDIEYNTHEYYLSYPITRNDYFWGRFLGSFFFVVVIGSSLIWGSLIGTWLGPKIGWLSADRLGPYHFSTYIQPFFVFLIPNLLLTSSIFFGLVAYTRNVKVIYTGGVILYLGYITSLFILHNLSNKNDIFYMDAFGITPIAIIGGNFSPQQSNTDFIALHGLMLTNRIIWTAVGLAILAITYYRFSFTRFFSGGRDKKDKNIQSDKKPGFLKRIPSVITGFGKGYRRSVIYTLSKIELLSVVRDNYFRLILGTGILFLGFIFWMGFGQRFGVQDLPRTVLYMDIYNHNFIFFVFIILLFYTGETVHREKLTRFAIINDALPPADWILYASKLIALVCLAFILATIPVLVGIIIQLVKGYTILNIPIYLAACYAISLPLFMEIIMFSFAIHVLINNKFAGHAVGFIIWTLMLLGPATGRFDYKLLLYSYTPDYVFSDLDGISPAIKPLFWFNIYWLCSGALLLVLAILFYYRGIISSFRERIRLAKHRFAGKIVLLTGLFFIGFLCTGFYNYYNVSFLNTWLTRQERDERKVAFERQLKRYEKEPLPTVIKLQLFADIFPGERRTTSTAFITLVNKTRLPITEILLDGDRLSTYDIKYNGSQIPFTNPLIYPRAKFSLLNPARDTSMYRLYRFPAAWQSGDTAMIEVHSTKETKGFSNNISGTDILHNGTAFDGGLPEMGYDDDEELMDESKRKEYRLPEREQDFPPQNDSVGQTHLIFSDQPAGLLQSEATISTSSDQVAVAPGKLVKKWTQNGRAYYHYIQHAPSYPSYAIVSAKYTTLNDKVVLDNGKPVGIELYYAKSNGSNIKRFMDAYKDGLSYFSKAYGTYQFDQIHFVESSIYTSDMASFPNLQAFSERFGWNASFDKPGLFDYCYFYSVYQLGHQWWMFQVAPNHTLGSNDIDEGLAKYGAFLLYEKKFGIDRMKEFLSGESWWYTIKHHYNFEREYPLINSNMDWVWDTKAGVILFGLKDLIGEDSLNSALREFYETYYYRNTPPYAGSNDLYRIIKKHVPDSLQYYLTDSWEKITIYNNKVEEVTVNPLGKNDEFKVHIKLHTGKTYTDSARNDIPAKSMNDLIEIGITSGQKKSEQEISRFIYLKKLRFTAGEHEIDIIVKGKPGMVSIDPYHRLIDNNAGDNFKNLN
jgi:ABC-2 type transport system permease protein